MEPRTGVAQVDPTRVGRITPPFRRRRVGSPDLAVDAIGTEETGGDEAASPTETDDVTDTIDADEGDGTLLAFWRAA